MQFANKESFPELAEVNNKLKSEKLTHASSYVNNTVTPNGQKKVIIFTFKSWSC